MLITICTKLTYCNCKSTLFANALSLAVNAFGPVRMCKAFLPIFKRQQIEAKAVPKSLQPRILNLSSVAGLISLGGMGGTAYQMSKSAADAFSQSFRFEAKKWGIAVVSVNPSFHNTPLLTKTSSGIESGTVPKEMHEEYGDDYVEKHKKYINDCMSRGSWDWMVVVESMLMAIEAKSPPTQIVAGLDAKFGFMLLRMLPEWTRQMFVEFITPPSTPAAMMISSEAEGSSDKEAKKTK